MNQLREGIGWQKGSFVGHLVHNSCLGWAKCRMVGFFGLVDVVVCGTTVVYLCTNLVLMWIVVQQVLLNFSDLETAAVCRNPR